MMRASAIFAPGQTISTERDQYELLSELGRGGMGLVFKAREVSLDRLVAIKTFMNDFDQAAMQRFLREAKLLANLNHPNIVHVYSTHVHQNHPFVVMEYVEGPALSDLLSEQKRLPSSQFYRIFEDMLAAVQYLHEQGIVHRDIKPSNILVTTDGTAKLTDLGIAKDISSEQMQRMTRTGAMLGSPAYMSPEQCRAQPVDARSDIYSLACTMYEAIAGEPLFKGESALDVMYRHINSDTQTLGDIADPALSAVLRKALQKEPAERFASASEFKDAFLKAKAGEATAEPRSKRKPIKRAKFDARAIAVATAVILGGGLWYFVKSDQAVIPRRSETDEFTGRMVDQFCNERSHYGGRLPADRSAAWTARFEDALAKTKGIRHDYRAASLRYDIARQLLSLYPEEPRSRRVAIYELCFDELPAATLHGMNVSAYLDLLTDMRHGKLYDESKPFLERFQKVARAHGLKTGDAFATLYRAIVAADRHQIDDSIKLLRAAVAQYDAAEPEATSVPHLDAYRFLSASLQLAGRPEEALKFVDQGLKVAERMPITSEPMTAMMYEQNRRALALTGMSIAAEQVEYPKFKSYEKKFLASAAAMGTPEAARASESERRDALAKLATAYFRVGRYTDAYNVCEPLVALEPTNPVDKATRVQALIVMSGAALLSAQYQKALDTAMEAEAHRDEAGRPRYDTVARAERIMAQASARLHREADARSHFELAQEALNHAPANELPAERSALAKEWTKFEQGGYR